jgi:hypothetical protein
MRVNWIFSSRWMSLSWDPSWLIASMLHPLRVLPVLLVPLVRPALLPPALPRVLGVLFVLGAGFVLVVLPQAFYFWIDVFS